MYLEYWGLKRFPFENTADLDFYFDASPHHRAVEGITDAIVRRRGAVLLTGEIGCGKTTVIRHMLMQLPEDRYDIALLTYPCLAPVEMLREIHRQLDMGDAAGMNRNDLIRVLEEHMIYNVQMGRDTVLCIDEAQSIEDASTLEEVRLLLNFQARDRFLLTLLLSGQPELNKHLAKLPQLAQRMAQHFHLGPLDLGDTARYILHRLGVAGAEKPIFTREAVIAIYRASGGVPRRINHNCDSCLVAGMRQQKQQIDSQLVTQALGGEGVYAAAH